MSASDLFKMPIAVKCTADLPFAFQSMSGHEELGRLFSYDVELTSPLGNIEFKKVLGQSLTVTVPLDLVNRRYFNGIIVRFSRAGRMGRQFRYVATICPQLWLLTRTTDCRVFQGVDVPEVVRWMLKEWDIAVGDAPLLGSHRRREYLTQYRETDFQFISRIMEEEGIYYYFKHSEEAHEMVLADSMDAHTTRPSYEAVPLNSPAWPLGGERSDFLSGWTVTHQIEADSVILNDYDFRLRKGANIVASQSGTAEHGHGPLTVFDFPGSYLQAQDKRDADLKATQDAGGEYASLQVEGHQAATEHYHTSGNVRGLETGALFSISNIPELETAGFLITSTNIAMTTPTFESGSAGGGDDTFHIGLTAVDKVKPYRPARSAGKPRVHGPQTARVVGDPGISPDEQIWTDEYGRIKVLFFWDRHGAAPDQSAPGFADHGVSCWIRVATPWAGSNWGAVHIPRIGQEVVVQFLDGDPDRPLVTGSVYNADNMPPYTLPEHKTQSGIKSRSTPKGTASNFNEIRFEDKKGAEELFVHAEKTHTVQVKGSRSLSVGGSESVTVGGQRTTTVTKKDTVELKDEHKMTVTGLVTQNFNKGHVVNIYGGDQNIYLDQAKSEFVTQTFSMESEAEIVLQVGESKITITPSKIELTATQISITGSSMVEAVGGVIKLNS